MKIHEKDPNSATATAPPSPLKRRRLSSKRKLSHDAESEKEDPAPAKKVSPAPEPMCPATGLLADFHPKLLTCLSPHCFARCPQERVTCVHFLWVPPTPHHLAEPHGMKSLFHCSVLLGFSSWSGSFLHVRELLSPGFCPLALSDTGYSINVYRMGEWFEGGWMEASSEDLLQG